MVIEIVTIGDELLVGHIVNTNASYLGKYLTALGFEVRWMTTVGDDAPLLKQALATAMSRADIVIMTGGLGPTHDDITKNVAAEFFESGFVYKPEILDRLKQAFAARGIKMAAVNEVQAQVPEKATIIDNPVGTAPGLLFETAGKQCIILPGVPHEMKAMCETTVFPMLKGKGQTVLQKTIRTTGIAESSLFERLGDIQRLEEFAKVAFLPKSAGVDVRLTVRGTNPAECEGRLSKALQVVRDRAGEFIYAYDGGDLEEVVAQLFFEKKKTVAVAESCSGGMLANRLTNISGSSAYFERGVVAYSNRAKIEILGVPVEVIEKFGAVSDECAVAMAEGIRKVSDADFGISTTGIAGPTGGTAEKPVGLVYIGFAKTGESYSKRMMFINDRITNKERAVQAALNLLRKELNLISM
ncbi:MAG TPA: competence/damage-inducible protein A [bacterium]